MNHRNELLVAIMMVLAFFVFGCSSGGSNSGGGSNNSSSSSQNTPLNVTGTWKGSGVVQGKTASTTFILKQDGNNVSGTWDGQAITGSVSDNKFNFNLTPFTDSGIYYTGNGSATVSGNTMSGNISVTGTYRGNSATVSATFNVTRSNAKEIQGYTQSDELIRAIMDSITK
jgi:hypothetical protein